MIYLSKQQHIDIHFHSSCSVREQLIPNNISAAVHGSRTKLSSIIHLLHTLLKTALLFIMNSHTLQPAWYD